MSERTFPVIEVFGPTIQGEGALAGQVTHFIRFGGCDYRCEWCDSLYAVEPELVREHAEKLTVPEIVSRLVALDHAAPWVTLSGGNPALMLFEERKGTGLVGQLQEHGGFKVAVETQGSVWRPWLADVDMLTVSPKPPSSGMATPANMRAFACFAEQAVTLIPRQRRSLKVVVFDDADLSFFEPMLVELAEDWDCFISVGTDRPGEELRSSNRISCWSEGTPVEEVQRAIAIEQISDRMRWLYDEVASRPALYHCTVLPQLHVLAWGHARAV